LTQETEPKYWEALDGAPLEDDDLTDIAVELVLAVMRSASTDQIRPIDWWPRAKAALEVAASRARTWPHLISRMGQKLGIDAYRSASSKVISSLGRTVTAADAFTRFRRLAERDALYIVAEAQVMREEQRAAEVTS
jgi:hypothetical protein